LLTFEQIKDLIELVAERRLQTLEIERSGFRLKIEGQAGGQTASAAGAAGDPAAPGMLALTGPVAAASVSPAPAAAPGTPAVKAPPPQAHILPSPIVGTFYRASAPTSPAFVEVGSRVKKGQVLCIIEAMKLMNEIESDADGVIAEIYPQNAQPVEFGEPLFAISPA
jgi:acetyl-CoA carboxylase biotin carboxyl carrier protein